MKKVKHLLITVILLITSVIYSQSKEDILYSPLRTYHFDQTSEITNLYHEAEGGNLGLIYIRRNIRENNFYTEYHVGVMRNSFGDFCALSNIGLGYRVKNINLGLALGVATGYDDLYSIYGDGRRSKMYNMMPDFFSRNGLVINTVFNVSTNGLFETDKFKVDPLINISPAFINGGLTISF